ncbi:RNA recognition motif domain-containing protein [Vibrio ulleungensis]|uniref:RNA-binding protein n=1 Tax=Vibrio ulleungensis TaxID=2807619 RepID=A0ABS2HS04_9VIBR|nr:RNA-binding protein [Vibrio ulleungensis]MBM7038667.1 RNA-binding protein [Vibrio ulleungensis]
MKSNQSFLFFAGATVILAVVAQSLALNPAIAVIAGAVLGFIFLKPSSKQTASTPISSSKVDGDENSQTLYVGNLPYRANEKNVRDLFDEHGKVLNVRLMKDKRTGKRRGFGFVVVAAEDADKVISALNDAEYMQRTLKVRVANDPKHPSEDSAE